MLKHTPRISHTFGHNQIRPHTSVDVTIFRATNTATKFKLRTVVKFRKNSTEHVRHLGQQLSSKMKTWQILTPSRHIIPHRFMCNADKHSRQNTRHPDPPRGSPGTLENKPRARSADILMHKENSSYTPFFISIVKLSLSLNILTKSRSLLDSQHILRIFL